MALRWHKGSGCLSSQASKAQKYRGAYLRPTKLNEEDVDAVWLDERKGVIFLQMTINESKRRVNGRRINQILEALNTKNAELWFVMPEHKAAKFAVPDADPKHLRKRVAYPPREAG